MYIIDNQYRKINRNINEKTDNFININQIISSSRQQNKLVPKRLVNQTSFKHKISSYSELDVKNHEEFLFLNKNHVLTCNKNLILQEISISNKKTFGNIEKSEKLKENFEKNKKSYMKILNKQLIKVKNTSSLINIDQIKENEIESHNINNNKGLFKTKDNFNITNYLKFSQFDTNLKYDHMKMNLFNKIKYNLSYKIISIPKFRIANFNNGGTYINEGKIKVNSQKIFDIFPSIENRLEEINK